MHEQRPDEDSWDHKQHMKGYNKGRENEDYDNEFYDSILPNIFDFF
jgi:hypothetical protein